MKQLLVGALAIVALGAQATRADAALFTLTAGGAGETVNFTTAAQGQPDCATPTCSASATFTLVSSTELTITLTNTSTDGLAGINVITALGFDTTPNIDLTQTTTTFNLDWKQTASGGALNMEVNNTSNQGINNGIDDTGPTTLTIDMVFTGGQSFDTLTFDDSQIHIQACSTTGDCSTKFTADGPGEGPGDGGGDGPPEGPGPEPASLLLFGTALSALGVRLRRAVR